VEKKLLLAFQIQKEQSLQKKRSLTPLLQEFIKLNHMKRPQEVENKPLFSLKLKPPMVATRPMLKYQPRKEEILPTLKSPPQLVVSTLKLENQQPLQTEVTLMLFQSQPQMDMKLLDHLLPQLPKAERQLLAFQLHQELKPIPEILDTLLVERLTPFYQIKPQMDTLKELPLITQ
jgi:hypothetical protein